MARCGCASDQCSCTVVAGENVEVSGTGSATNPYVISAATEVSFEGGGGSAERITGELIAYVGAVAPAGWLLCNGAEVSRSVYASLFSIMGTAYGAGNGTSTFNLPNLTAKFPMGADGTDVRGTSGGANSKVLLTANLPSHHHSNFQHTHTMDQSGMHDHALSRSTSTGGNNANIPQGTTTQTAQTHAAIEDDGLHSHTIDAGGGADTGDTGSGTAFNNRPAYLAVTYIIKT